MKPDTEVEPERWAVVPSNLSVSVHDLVGLAGMGVSASMPGWAVVWVSKDGRLVGVVPAHTVEAVR